MPSTNGVSFDVVRCAVADYFRAQGAADLCLASWCNLDCALGEMLGLTLHRTTTLVDGFVLALFYGPDVDWARNVLAAGLDWLNTRVLDRPRRLVAAPSAERALLQAGP